MARLCSFHILIFICSASNCYNFDKNYFGVTFSPYVKQAEEGKFPNADTYTFDNIKTMLTVIGGKFSKVLMHGYCADNHTENSAYYNCLVSRRSGEAAALINRENGKNSLSLTIYLPFDILDKSKDVNILLYLEIAEKANKIFPGTVENVIFDCNLDVSGGDQILNYLRTHKKRASEIGVKLGVGEDCVKLSQQNDELIATRRELIATSDVILYGIGPNNRAFDPETTFDSIATQFLSFSNFSLEINKNVDVAGWTEWSSSGLMKWETVDNLQKFWERANNWASTHKYTIYLHEAIDNPWRQNPPREAHSGWWKLEENLKINLVDAYIEKALENEHKQRNVQKVSRSAESTFYYWIGSTVVVSTVLTLMVLFIVFRFCRGKRSSGLSAKDIRDFIFGTSEKSAGTDNSAALLETALKGPYDKSLEIPKRNLKIDNNHVLGSGTFGCVFKALIIKDKAEPIHVAVKVANEKSPLVALKSLLSEIKIMSYLGKHPNIVTMVGAYTAELSRGVVYVATELCTIGSLESYLRKNQYVASTDGNNIEKNKSSDQKSGQNMKLKSKSSILFQEMLQWSHEIACGMEYLEKKHVVHADLATRNILLNADKIAKIADFGLSRRIYNYLNYIKTHQEPMPWRWMAVESLKKMEFSSKSDVWSYGVTLWEIFSNGDVPYQGLSWTTDFVNELINGLRPGRPCPCLF